MIPSQRKRPLDLDAALAWTGNPRAEALDYGLLMRAWHTLAYLGVTREPPVVIDVSEHDGPLGLVADKVHIGYDVTTNPKTSFASPEWSVDNLTLLASTLREALGRLSADAG